MFSWLRRKKPFFWDHNSWQSETRKLAGVFQGAAQVADGRYEAVLRQNSELQTFIEGSSIVQIGVIREDAEFEGDAPCHFSCAEDFSLSAAETLPAPDFQQQVLKVRGTQVFALTDQMRALCILNFYTRCKEFYDDIGADRSFKKDACSGRKFALDLTLQSLNMIIDGIKQANPDIDQFEPQEDVDYIAVQ